MAKSTIKSLQTELGNAKLAESDALMRARESRERAVSWEAQAKEAREQFSDLKKRLHNSETEVARLNGYLARVREDDIVREDLLTVGEPDGQQRLVPKRKHEFLGQREYDGGEKFAGIMGTDDYGRRKTPKHWIEY